VSGKEGCGLKEVKILFIDEENHIRAEDCEILYHTSAFYPIVSRQQAAAPHNELLSNTPRRSCSFCGYNNQIIALPARQTDLGKPHIQCPGPEGPC